MVFWRQRRQRMARAVAGFLLALFWLELTHILITPDIIPSWFARVSAATAAIDPNGNGVGSGTRNTTTCGAGGFFDCLNDAVRNPTAPTTTGDFLDLASGAVQSFEMGTIAGVDTVTAVSVQVHHLGNPTNAQANMRLTVSLWNAAETVEYGTGVQLLYRGTAGWDTVNFSSLSLSQAELDGLRVRLRCDRVGGGQTNFCRNYAMYADVTYTEAVNLEVSAIGSQIDVVAGDTNAYIGGAFVFRSLLGSRSVNSITIAETGSIHAQDNINNVKLFYELDTSSPFDCVGVNLSSTSPQYGSTVAGGFNAANGTASFFQTVSVSTTQALCVFAVLDVTSDTAAGTTIDVEITNPTANVTASAGSVIGPATAVALPGTTNVNKAQIRQTAYHWRNDDGSETAASSATGGAENTVYEDFPKGDNVRLRLGVSNAGTATSAPQQFRLEYAERVTTCTAATGWIDVGASGGDFDMDFTTNFTDGGNTTNIATSTGGVSDPSGKTFLTPNGGLRDTNSQTGNITLSTTQFTELEYSIIADPDLAEGTAYCFRVSNAGTPLDGYDNYAQLVIAADVRLSSFGAMPATVGIPQTNYYVGGSFVLRENSSTRTVNSVTITHTGTANEQLYLSNAQLFYKLDTSTPYNCEDQVFAGSTQFGSTVASFSDPQGTVTFTDSVTITTTQALCLYLVVSISEDATTNDTIAFSIAGGGADVGLSSGSIAPLSAVSLTGSTTLQGSTIDQYAYHWRNDDGTETGATSATGGTANTAVSDYILENPIRLRIGLNNTSGVNAPSRIYRLEYGVRVTTCANVGVWQPVASSTDWVPFATTNLTHNGNTTNILAGVGGIADIGGKTFAGTNGVRTTEAQTASVALLTTNFYEYEFSIRSSSTAQFSTTYCFRLARVSGTPLESYTNYPTLTTEPRRDFRVQRGSVDVSGTGLTVNAGTSYIAPKSTSTAFVRITGVSYSGSGPNQNSIDTSAAITTSDIRTSFTIARPTGAAGSTRVTWELIDFIAAPGTDNEMMVRGTGALTFASGNTVLNGPTISVTDPARVVVYVTGVHSNNAGRDNYFEQQVTSEWDTANSRPVFRRGASSAATLLLSYAVVEYTGINWKVQRIEHTYTAAGAIETRDIPEPLNNIARSFTHIQKRMGAFNTVQSFGHRAWINSIGEASFELQSGATTPAEHTTVMWIIENFQTSEGRMRTQRQLGSTSGGTAPLNISVTMPSAIEATRNTSIAAVARSTDGGNNRNYPRPLAGFFINSNTTYQVWRGDTGSDLFYATELIEWPTHGLALRQNNYRVYADNGELVPSDPWPPGPINLGENMSVTLDDEPLGLGDRVRLRMAIRIDNANWPQNLNQFKLQYGVRATTCSAVASWTDVGNPASGSIWRLFDVSGPGNGTVLSTNPPTGGDLLLSVSSVAGVLSELQPSVPNPFGASPGDHVEFDWPLEHNGAVAETTYCFRMIFSSNDPIDSYILYPQIRTAGFTPSIKDWRWYDDATVETPLVPLSVANVSPNEVPNRNQIALRVTIGERKGVSQNNVKYRLEYDQSPLFNNPQPVVAIASCTDTSVWCYTSVPQTDNATITTALLSTSDSCIASAGLGCGTHNSSPNVASTFTHQAFADTEFAFYIESRTARVGAVYYFRMVENSNNTIVSTFASSTYPSLVSESANLVLTVDGLPAGTTTSGITTDRATEPDTVAFSDFVLRTPLHAAHRVSIDTNASDGYRVLMRTRGPFSSASNVEIDNITGTNAIPVPWATGCVNNAKSCVGYHTSDATLSGNSTRFALNDTYAGLSTTAEEVMYSPIPTSDNHDIVFKLEVRHTQPPGQYGTEIVYIAMPMY